MSSWRYPDPMTAQSAHVYLIVGDDPYLIESATKEIIGGVGELSVTEFGPHDPVGTIIETLRTGSLFAEPRVVITRGLEEFLAESQRQLIAYIEDPSPETIAIFVSSKSLPKVAAAAKKTGRVIDATRGRRADLAGWIRGESKTRGLKIDEEGTAALLDAIGEERLAIANALDELSLAVGRGGRIGADKVREHFRGRADTKVFTFIDAAANRNAGHALQALHLLLRSGESTSRIFWTLTSHVRMLLLAEGSPSAVAKRLGLPDWRAEKLVRQARNFTRNELIDVFVLLADADRKIKNSEETEELILERIVMRMAGIKKAVAASER